MQGQEPCGYESDARMMVEQQNLRKEAWDGVTRAVCAVLLRLEEEGVEF